jgi:hypothetical protein
MEDRIRRLGTGKSSDNRPDLYGVAGAAIWPDKFMCIRCQGGNSLHRTRECIEQVIRFCLRGAHMLILVGYPQVCGKWRHIQQAAQNDFAGVNPAEELEGRPRIASLIGEGRTLRSCRECKAIIRGSGKWRRDTGRRW